MEETSKKIFSLRKDFVSAGLSRKDLNPDPLGQFAGWMQDAIDGGSGEPNAFVLSTTGEAGRVSSRVLLLRGFDDSGFSFFTNYNSQKAHAISQYPKVCLNFFWLEFHRQVRIEGLAIKVSQKVSDEYFASRPRESQISAWASLQSSTIENRAALEAKWEEAESRFRGKTVPRPPLWGGYTVKPDFYEFWQGRQGRLHDRFSYQLNGDGQWIIDRLCP